MSRPLLRVLHAAQRLSFERPWRRFEQAARRPDRAQLGRLQAILLAHAGTAYGQAHGFERVTSLAGWQSRVPIVDYDALAPWIERVARGEARVLSGDPVLMLERSGGSTDTNKLIPYTKGLLAEFSAATEPWLRDLHAKRPRLFGTRSYWSISPATRQHETTEGGLPIGFEDDTDYFHPLVAWALKKMMAVPGSVARLPDMDRWRRSTAEHLLAADDLGLISVWSPTFLTNLMRFIEADLEGLLSGLTPARAAAIRERLDRRGRLTGECLWPRLEVVSSWTDGVAARFIPELQRWFPATPIQGKGLLATEGVVTFPLWGHSGAVVAVASAFYEFIDLQHPTSAPLLAHELRPGGEYSPLLTTSGGLHRYHLKDVVRCVGRYRQTPLLRFVGKLDKTSDLVGEKVTARQVEEGVAIGESAAGVRLDFALLAPTFDDDGAAPRYTLYVEARADDAQLTAVAHAVEAHLATGHHYRYARELGQLGPLQWRRVEGGWATYQATCQAHGQRAGDIKPTPLDPRPIWAEAFASVPGRVISGSGRRPRSPARS